MAGEAIIALGGVALGSLTTLGSSLVLERRRDRNETRRARRLVLGELLEIWIDAQGLSSSLVLPVDVHLRREQGHFLPTEQWHEWRATLAGSLKALDWGLAHMAYNNVELVRRLLLNSVPGGALVPKAADDLAALMKMIEDVYARLAERKQRPLLRELKESGLQS
jgi:hypothetical protein